ncbi:MAG TPA: penicillin-binding transpeptidase domain-containing protein [Rhabdochlamydiaceae bacterium]|nr:penicillin-binding transpeptidase domain-containing protein [Rhabdochlamydiaceae bacterium]
MSVDYKISSRTSRVLNLFLMGLLFIAARVWYLTVLERDVEIQNASRPQRRSMVQKVERATIRDRFNLPLATNKIQYNAAVCYAQIRQIPTAVWKKEEGKPCKIAARKLHVENLAQLLASELSMDPVAIEDMIHGKASLLPHTPFVIKEDISEEVYYRLKMAEKDWLGLSMERSAKRIYPQGKTACDVIGYIGMINSTEYYKIAQEIKELQNYLNEREEGKMLFLPKGYESPLQVRERLKELQEKAYTINDLVGKSGIEKFFDEKLRGLCGKKTYEVNVKGHFLRELPGEREPVSGQRLILSLSSELEQTAEELLSSYELFQDQRDQERNPNRRHPWQRGGAVVAMLPQTGEIVALASYPRFNPNDFTALRDPQKRREKRSSILKWLECEAHIGEIWDGKSFLSRELYDPKKEQYSEDSQALTWDYYLKCILPQSGCVRKAIDKVTSLKIALQLQEDLKELLLLSGQDSAAALIETIYHGGFHIPLRRSIKKEEKEAVRSFLNLHSEEMATLKGKIDPYLEAIPHNDDKLLFIDILKIAANSDDFSPGLIDSIGSISLADYRLLAQGVNRYLGALRAKVEDLYRQSDFKIWREENFKSYLEERRAEEKKHKKIARPYPEYLERLLKKMFTEFWEKNRYHFIETLVTGSAADADSLDLYFNSIIQTKNNLVHDPNLEKLKLVLAVLTPDLRTQLLKTLRPFEELKRPLLGHYPNLLNSGGLQFEKHLASAFYPYGGFGYARSQAFRQSTPQGSIFKLAVAYEALKKRYEIDENNLSPLTITDYSYEHKMGLFENGEALKRLYKGGRLPKSSHPNIGRVDLQGALEQSSNIYFSLLAGDYIEQPDVLENMARSFGYGERTGIELPNEYGGNIPNDLAFNKTGLYAYAIGQHSLVVTPLQTAVMLSTIANGGQVLKPKIVQLAAGNEPSVEKEDLIFSRNDFPLKDQLSLIGINFPLFTQTLTSIKKGLVSINSREVRRELPFPEKVHDFLLEGMHRVMTGEKGTARPSIIRARFQDPKAVEAYQKMGRQVVGKTGTAEILYKQTIDAESKAEMEKHVWFAGISYTDEELKTPELVVVVYLRFGDAGRDAAPLALRLFDKWREINATKE